MKLWRTEHETLRLIAALVLSVGRAGSADVHYVDLNSTNPMPPYNSNSVLNFSCTTPQPPDGPGNIIDAPLFVDASVGNDRLQSGSPCINSGPNNATSAKPFPVDLDGNPRIAGGTEDMGAFEFQSPSSVLSYAWAQQYGLPTDGSADFADADGDSMSNWQEWIAGTDPTNALSALRLLNRSPGPSGTIVTWESVINRSYFLESTTNLGAASVFSVVSGNIVGQASTTSFVDATAMPGSLFYRVGVQQ